MRFKLVDENKLMIFITFGLGKCRPSSFIESFIEIKVGQVTKPQGSDYVDKIKDELKKMKESLRDRVEEWKRKMKKKKGLKMSA